MSRIAMLGRFQPVNLGHENAIRRAQQYGQVVVGVYATHRSYYNPFTTEEVEIMLHNVADVETFVFHPTLNPFHLRGQLLRHAGTIRFYTRSVRSAVLAQLLGLDAIYDDRDEFDSSHIRKALYQGGEQWRCMVNPANIKIIEDVARRLPPEPRFFSVGLLNSLYKHV